MSVQLYRHFDAAGRLLYSGILRNVGWRLMAHERTAGWWADVRRIEITPPFRSRAEALEAEATAIKNERPLYNQHHHPNPIEPPIADAMAGKDWPRPAGMAKMSELSPGTSTKDWLRSGIWPAPRRSPRTILIRPLPFSGGPQA